MAPPTATVSENATSAAAEQIASLKVSSEPTGSAAKAARNAAQLHANYVFYHDNKEPFDIPGAHIHIEGPSPYAAKDKEGSSVLTDWQPKKSGNKLDSTYKYLELTPGMGREYRNVNLVDVLNDDQLLHDLAVIVAERGVVFFRNQSDLTVEQQKQLSLKLGRAAGNPESSGLHIHPTALAGGLLNEEGKIDPEVTLINSRLRKTLYKNESGQKWSGGSDTVFHSDVSFEPVPAALSIMRIVETPSSDGTEEEFNRPGGGPVGGSGGDTLWANGYALAEKVSPSFLAYLETLKGEFYQPLFKSATNNTGVPLYTAPRGAPENVGDKQIAVHPLVRTNPTTGWKSIFAIGSHFHRVLGVTQEESDLIKTYLNNLLYQSPELQLRFKWNSHDLGIWDNRSTYHSAIVDIGSLDGEDIAVRTGLRTLSTGERPFFDPKSKTQSQALLERLAENRQA